MTFCHSLSSFSLIELMFFVSLFIIAFTHFLLFLLIFSISNFLFYLVLSYFSFLSFFEYRAKQHPILTGELLNCFIEIFKDISEKTWKEKERQLREKINNLFNVLVYVLFLTS